MIAWGQEIKFASPTDADKAVKDLEKALFRRAEYYSKIYRRVSEIDLIDAEISMLEKYLGIKENFT